LLASIVTIHAEPPEAENLAADGGA
jgi:hypothetical protein